MDNRNECGAPKLSLHYRENTLGGSQVIEALRAAMTDAGIESGDARADLIGHFCNRWNAAVATAAVARQAPAAEYDAGGPLREGWEIFTGLGHSGYGVYAVVPACPDEGAVCLATIDPSDVAGHTQQTVHPADELGAFARWYIEENGYAPDHRDEQVVKQFKAWCGARGARATNKG